MANSAVTLPCSAWNREGMPNHIGEHPAHLVGAEYYDEQASKADGGHCGDG